MNNFQTPNNDDTNISGYIPNTQPNVDNLAKNGVTVDNVDFSVETAMMHAAFAAADSALAITTAAVNQTGPRAAPKVDFYDIDNDDRKKSGKRIHRPIKTILVGVLFNGVIYPLDKSGGIMMISAKAKGGKTGCLGALVAGAIRRAGDENVDCLGFYVAPCPFGKRVIHIDTEQSEEDHEDGVYSIVERANYGDDHPEHLHTYDFTSIHDRFLALEQRLFNPKLPPVHMIFVDGIADMVGSVNDEDTAVSVCEKIIEWCKQLDCGMVVVLHENQKGLGGAGVTRGWLGSQLERKAYSHISISYNNDEYVIDFINCRKTPRNLPQLTFVFSDLLKRFVSNGFREKKAVGKPRSLTDIQIEEIKVLRQTINQNTQKKWTVAQLALVYDVSTGTISGVSVTKDDDSDTD